MSEIIDVNWLAVIVGFVVSYILGGLWFSPMMFGKKWLEGVGLSTEGPDKPPVSALSAQFVGTFLLSWVVGVTVSNDALLTITLITLTVVVLSIANGFFIGKTAYVRHTEAGFTVVMVVIMIICQGIF